MTKHARPSAFLHNHAERTPKIPVYRAVSPIIQNIGQRSEVIRIGCHDLRYHRDARVSIGVQFAKLNVIRFHFFRWGDKGRNCSINAPEIGRKQVAVYAVSYSLEGCKVYHGAHFKPVMGATIVAVIFYFFLLTGRFIQMLMIDQDGFSALNRVLLSTANILQAESQIVYYAHCKYMMRNRAHFGMYCKYRRYRTAGPVIG